jgi:cytochrome c-type biogenesis protein CcmH/NrfF
MNFVLKVGCDNAAFEDPDIEVSRILREVAGRVEAGQKNGRIMDVNGNSVGEFFFNFDER